MTEYIPTKPQDEVIDSTNKTTLVIDEIPSDLAYGILVEALNQGDALTHDELVAEIKARTEGDKTIIHYAEAKYIMHEFIHGVCKDCLAREESFGEEDKDDEIYENTDYIQEAIERAKEGMRLQRNQDHIEFHADPNPTPTPPPMHR